MKFLKILGIIVLSIILLLGFGLIYVKTSLPKVAEAPNLKVELTPENIERGRYLANSVMGCMDCHAQRDATKFANPVIEGTAGAGGGSWTHENGFPGEMYAPNITPYALSDWTDGEIYRAITVGVNKEGNALFPIMPYPSYGKLSDKDIHAVIAYLRTLPYIEKEHPVRELDFPLNFIVNTIPVDPVEKMEVPDKRDRLAYGKYILTAAACGDCHTPQENGKYIEGMFMAGGFEFIMHNGTVCRSANLTPDKETGIGYWDLENFMNRFNTYRDSNYVARVVPEGEFNTEMPWEYYASMEDEDLEAIFTYLKSIKPVNHEVEKFSVVNTVP